MALTRREVLEALVASAVAPSGLAAGAVTGVDLAVVRDHTCCTWWIGGTPVTDVMLVEADLLRRLEAVFVRGTVNIPDLMVVDPEVAAIARELGLITEA